MSKLLFCILYFLFFILNGESTLETKTDIYIVYLGGRPHNDIDLLTDSHHDMLASVVGSKEQASKSMVYSYRHGFSGFAARLTGAQAQKISELPDVIDVLPNVHHNLKTTRSWDYLGFPKASDASHKPNTLQSRSNYGDGVIVGVLDSGICPEAPSFGDEGLGPIPSHWKGFCVSGDDFNATDACSKKLIGARWFRDGVEEEKGDPSTVSEYDALSPRDFDGHGTHVAATITGAFVGNVSHNGLGEGTIRGGAPNARLAVYKVCWYVVLKDQVTTQCPTASVLKGIDEAIRDGVDLISISLGSAVINFDLEVDKSRNPFAIGSFHAVSRGIPVICSGGNEGPDPYTVTNTAPWIITVAANSIDRTFPTLITLGNNKTLMGRAMFVREGNHKFKSLAYFPEETSCEDLQFDNSSLVAGKVLLCFTRDPKIDISNVTTAIQNARGVGLIVVKEYNDMLTPSPPENKLPFNVEVDFDIGTEIVRYIRYARDNATVKVSSSTTFDGKPLPTRVAHFSSRGPNSIAPAILKPDISAPGVNILAPAGYKGYVMMSGTSMAAPHISGIVALLKAVHPDWSASAIKSAIMTTAWNTDGNGSPIYSRENEATPFDMGAGIVNPNDAANPGLVYDIETIDYVHYLCDMGYRKAAISRIAESSPTNTKPISCPKESEAEKMSNLLDLNMPSITIPYLPLKNAITLKRTLTNVGPIDSVYKLVIKQPVGVNLSVKPQELVFNSATKKISVEITVSATSQANTAYNFGSITWTDGVHNVRSPVSVRAVIMV